MMNKLTLLFVAILSLIQYPLWFGKGGWVHLDDVAGQLARQKALNVQLKRRNAQLSAEVWDLKRGTELIEERARFEFGLIKTDEELFQFVDGS